MDGRASIAAIGDAFRNAIAVSADIKGPMMLYPKHGLGISYLGFPLSVKPSLCCALKARRFIIQSHSYPIKTQSTVRISSVRRRKRIWSYLYAVVPNGLFGASVLDFPSRRFTSGGP